MRRSTLRDEQSNSAICVENTILSRVAGLSKLYHSGARQQRHDTLRDAIFDSVPRSSGHCGFPIADALRRPNPQSTIRKVQVSSAATARGSPRC